MGLDMYLEKRTYVKNWNYMQLGERTRVTVTRGGEPLPGIDPSKVSYIIEEVGYWRKANAIHQWFVEHVQDGTDDCGYHYVEHEQLQELLDAVNTVLNAPAPASEEVAGEVHTGTTYTREGTIEHFEPGTVLKNPVVAQELLPTQSGFFFGGTNYDQYYVENLKQTKDILEAALASTSGDYYYHSSW